MVVLEDELRKLDSRMQLAGVGRVLFMGLGAVEEHPHQRQLPPIIMD
jgi:hypothetical protein